MSSFAALAGLEWSLGLSLALSYLLGSIPFGWLMAKLIRGVDIRTVGSGNIGATNAMRVLGKPLGIVAFLCDFGKGFAPAYIVGRQSGHDSTAMVLCAAAAVCGHVWPIFLRFKGGKAVATGLGGIVAIDPIVALIAGGVWFVVLMCTRFVALASIAMGIAFPVAAYLRMDGRFYAWDFVAGTSVLCALILVRHRTNISRMLAGEESRSRMGFGGKSKDRSDG